MGYSNIQVKSKGVREQGRRSGGFSLRLLTHVTAIGIRISPSHHSGQASCPVLGISPETFHTPVHTDSTRICAMAEHWFYAKSGCEWTENLSFI